MNSNLRSQIHNNMNLRETDELLEIWQDNDRVEWSDETFEVIKEILKQRGMDIPQQDEPVYEHDEEDDEDDEDDQFSAEELAILNDENPPAFYEPLEVLRLTKRLDWMVGAMIVFIIAYNILNFPASLDIAQRYLLGISNTTFVFIVSALIACANIIIGIITVYIPLKVLSNVLRILMEMEFNSRKAG